MSFTSLTIIQAQTFVLPEENIDTDQIIPARFLTVTTRDKIGQHAFHDWRYHADGTPTHHPLNGPQALACQILVAGHNFGCGSSREHAAWALADYGFRVVISSEIADIFRSNALKNGILPVILEKNAHQWLLRHPYETITVDLQNCEVRLPDNGGVHTFTIDAFSRLCLMQGIDEMGYLGRLSETITHYEKNHL